jgi:hypothetical protein
VRLLRIVGGNEEDQEMTQARSTSAKAGASALDRSEAEGADPRLVAELRQMAVFRGARPGSTTPSLAQLRLDMIAAEREAVIAMRDRNEIGDSVMRTLLGEFDHEEMVLSREGFAAQDHQATDSSR